MQILKPVLLACLAETASAQTFSIPVWYLAPYPSLQGGQLAAPTGFDQFIAPDGTIAFRAFLNSAQVICTVTPAGPIVLARQGDPAPGKPGLTLDQFDSIHPDDAGVAFRASLAGAAGMYGVYRADAQGIARYLSINQPAPGIPGATVLGLADLTVNRSVAILPGSSTGPGSGESLWKGTPGAVGLLARRNSQAPGMAPGRTLSSLGDTPAVNASGQMAFSAPVGPAPFTAGIWSGPAGAPTLLYQSGDPAPGFPGGTLCDLWNPILNAQGAMAFASTVCDPSGEHVVLWLSSSGTLAAIAREGQTAPGTNVQFFDLTPFSAPAPVLTNAGLLVFRATLTGPGVNSTNNTGIWAGRPGDLHLIARTGDQAPGFPPGQVYQSFIAFGNGQAFSANSRGHIIFPAAVTGAGNLLYMSDATGHATAILRNGTSVPTGPGQADTVTLFTLPLNSGSSPSGRTNILDDTGRAVVHLRLSSPSFGLRQALALIQLPPNCYGNCDLSSAVPVLTANDFQCFLNRFAAGDLWANCDGSTITPVLTANDFQCFLNQFAAGCS